jgi:OmpA-OmpF porin, OOP family
MLLTRLPGGNLVISTARSGYAPRVDTMQIIGDREQTAIIALNPLAYGGITGVIYDVATGKPIGGAITYRGPVQGGLSADPELGSYVLRSILVGEYVLAASGPTGDYAAQTCTLKVESGRITNQDFYLQRRHQTNGQQIATPEPVGAEIRPQSLNAAPESVSASTGPESLRTVPEAGKAVAQAEPSNVVAEPGSASVPPELQNVGFEPGKADISPQFESVLVKAGEMLVASPNATVELAGHADPGETTDTQYPSKWELSQARGEVVKQYLVAKFGIAPERLTVHGYGDTQPIAPGETEAGRAMNRRTEFRVTGQ